MVHWTAHYSAFKLLATRTLLVAFMLIAIVIYGVVMRSLMRMEKTAAIYMTIETENPTINGVILECGKIEATYDPDLKEWTIWC